MVAGSSQSLVSQDTDLGDIWVLKLGQDGSLGCGFGVYSTKEALTFDTAVQGVVHEAFFEEDAFAQEATVSTSNQDSTGEAASQCP